MTIRTSVFWIAHGTKYREMFKDVDSHGVDFMAFPGFIHSVSANHYSEFLIFMYESEGIIANRILRAKVNV